MSVCAVRLCRGDPKPNKKAANKEAGKFPLHSVSLTPFSLSSRSLPLWLLQLHCREGKNGNGDNGLGIRS